MTESAEPVMDLGLGEPRLIRELVARRRARLQARGGDPEQLRSLLEPMRRDTPTAAAILEDWARRCDLPEHALLLLDGGAVDLACPHQAGAESDRALGLYVIGPDGPVLGLAWAVDPDEAAHVDLRALGPEGGWRLGLPGSLGVAGIAASGLACLSLLLRPRAAGVGVPGSALLQQLLTAPRIEQARGAIEATALVDGRCWMLADGRSFLGFEQLAGERILTRVGVKTGHVHANHCFDPSLRQREAVPRSAVSFRRLELASTLYVQQRPNTAAAVLDFFDAVEDAAFPVVADRPAPVHARTLFAVELRTGRAHLRRRAGEVAALRRFHTPFADDLDP